MILDVQKNCNLLQSSSTTFIQIPLKLTSYITIVQLSKPGH